MGDPIDEAAARRYGQVDAGVEEDPIEAAARRRYGEAPSADPIEAAAAKRYGLDRQNQEALPRMAQVATEGARWADPKAVRKAKADVSARFQNPQIRRELRAKLDVADKTIRAADRAPKVANRLAEKSGDVGLKDLVLGTTAEADKPLSEWEKKGAIGKALHVFGLPGALTRNAIGAAVSDQRDFQPLEVLRGNRGSGEDLSQDLRRGVETGNPLAYGPNMALSALSHTAGYVGGMAGAGTGILADMVLGKDPNVTDEQRADAYMETVKGSPETSRATLAELAFDPLTWTGFGGGAKGATGIAGNQILRAGRGIIPAEKAAAASAEAAELMGRLGGTMELGPALAKLGENYGIPAEQMARVFGEGGRYAGRGQMTAGLPMFSEKLTGEVVGPLDAALSSVSGGKLRAPEQVFRKGVDKARDMLGWSDDLGYHGNLAVKRQAAKARNLALQQTAEELEVFRKDVAKLAPTDKGRREEIVRRVLDPDYDARVVQSSQDIQPGEVLRATTDDNGAQVLAAVKPKEGAAPLQMTEREQQFAKAFKDYFDKQGQALQDAGLLKDWTAGHNLLTGTYVPRMYRGAQEGTGLLSQASAPRGASPLMHRGAMGGRALGRDLGKGLEATFDPFEIVTKYQPKVERAKQTAGFRQWAAETLGVPVDQIGLPHSLALQQTHEVVNGKWVPRKVLSKLEQQFEVTAGPKGLGKQAASWVMSRFKTLNTVGAPRYFFTNVFGDSTLMAAAGFRNPKWFRKAGQLREMADDAVVVSGPTQDFRAGEVRRLLKEAGIFKGGMTSAPFEIQPGKAMGKARTAFQETAEGAARAAGELNDGTLGRASKWLGRRKTEAYDTVASLGVKPIGEKLASYWDEHAKAAFFMDRLAKGDAPNIAAERTFEVLFDYADQDAVLRNLSRYMAFPVYQYKAMGAVPRIVARNPWSINATKAASEMVGAGPGEIQDPAPQYAQERSLTVPLGDTSRSIVRRLADKAPFNAEIDPGYGMGGVVRTPLIENMAGPLELLYGNPDPMALGLSPPLVAGMELLTEQDYLTKRPMERPGSPLGMFPAGTPGVPASLETGTHPEDKKQEIPWLARYLPGMLASPQLLLGANMAMGGQYLGRHRAQAPDAAQRNALSGINILTGLPLYLTDPATPMLDLARKPQVENAAELKGLTGRSKKKDKDSKKRGS